MIFDESDPIRAFREQLKDLIPDPHEFEAEDGRGIMLEPFSAAGLARIFEVLTGSPLSDYLPEALTRGLEGLQVTSRAAIEGEAEHQGLSLMQVEPDAYRADFAVAWATPWKISDDLTVQNPFVAFVILFAKGRGLSVSVELCAGHVHFLEYAIDLEVSVALPSLLLQAVVRPDREPNEAAPEKLAGDYLSALQKSGAARINIEAIRFSAAPTLQNYHLNLSVTDVLDLHDKLRVARFQAEIRYQGSASEYGLLAYTDIEIGFATAPLVISLAAELEKSGDKTKWAFSGGIPHTIQVSDLIADLAQLFGENGAPVENPYHLPEFIANTEITHLGFAFEIETGKTKSEQDYKFILGLNLPLADRDLHLEIYAHYERAANGYGLELTGELALDGFQLGVAFAKKTAGAGISETIIVGSLQTDKLKLSSSALVALLSPGLAEAVPLEVDVELLGLLLGLHAGTDSQKEYLFRLGFGLDFKLDGFPLIGQFLEAIRFTNGQLLAASRDWTGDEVEAVNDLLVHFDPQPSPLGMSTDPALAGVLQGISLSGTFQLAKDLGFPFFLNFGGQKVAARTTHDAPGGTTSATGPVTPPKGGAPEPDARSQGKLDKIVGAIRVRKVALVFEQGVLGLKITGGLTLVAFEFELMGLQVTVPQTALSDPSTLKGVEFNLDGFGAKIQKGTLSISGAFLRQHYPEQTDEHGALSVAAYDEYNGIVQVAFPPFSLTGMGSYARYDGHPSLFLFVALGVPMSVSPALLIEGLALGFGVHRNFILPALDEVLAYPLVQVSVTPPPPIDIQKMAADMHRFFPPTIGTYFVVAGIKFKAFGIVDTVAMLAVKLGDTVEIDLVGVSSIVYPAAFIELAWLARFAPEAGNLFIGGQLTSRSYLFVPEVELRGGFAVAAWFRGDHQGDFVVTIGGYHPYYRVPAHYPQHVPRLGISFHLAPITIKGEVYFAVTPQCLMLGGLLEASLEASFDASIVRASFKAAIRMALDAILFFEPFHYDVLIAADATLDADLAFTFYTKHIHQHLHLEVHIWGPDFSGAAWLDVGPKTFAVAFGHGSSARALPLGWEAFRQRFLQTADKDGNLRDNVCSVAVREGLLRKVQQGHEEVYVVDPTHLVLEAKSGIPLTDGTNPLLGVAPMDVRAGGYTAALKFTGSDDFTLAEIRDTVPAGIWGGAGLTAPNLAAGADGLVKNVLSGYRLVPTAGTATTETKTFPKDGFAYNTDQLPLAAPAAARAMQAAGLLLGRAVPLSNHAEFTGLEGVELTPVSPGMLLHEQVCAYALI